MDQKEYVQLTISLANMVKELVKENESLKEEIEILERLNANLLKKRKNDD